MDRTGFLSTAALGLAFIVLYGVRCWRKAEPVDVGVLVNIMLQSGGIVAGSFLILSTFVPELKERLSTLDIYILISGIVVCAVSAQGLKGAVWAGKAIGSAPRLPGPQPVAAPVIAVAQDVTKVG
ncbi:MAG: threonyl-tRNA synthetase [Gemmatimonadetes bacterium]|nr:threonyl-tRNA synthetase [Gemmatimonadota bacterium]